MQNKFIYMIGTSVVVRVNRGISNSNEPIFSIAKFLDVSKIQAESSPRRLKVHWFCTKEKSRIEQEPLFKNYYPLDKAAALSLHMRKYSSTASVHHSDLQIPFTNEVDTDEIFITLINFTRRTTLLINVQKKKSSLQITVRPLCLG